VVALVGVNGGGACGYMGFGDQVANEAWNATEAYQLPDQLLTPSTTKVN
jgi:hypothetical protein